MSSESKESNSSDRLPFEPNRKKDVKPAKMPAKSVSAKPAKVEKSAKAVEKKKQSADRRSGMQIPDDVSRRMVGRMAFFCGIPTSLGMLTFVASYAVVSQGWLKLPNTVVLLLSLGFFGLGVLGLSYGMISASWDEGRPGSLLGFEEFSTNVGRLTEAWKAARKQNTQE
jgi:hypothetical protein